MLPAGDDNAPLRSSRVSGASQNNLLTIVRVHAPGVLRTSDRCSAVRCLTLRLKTSPAFRSLCLCAVHAPNHTPHRVLWIFWCFDVFNKTFARLSSALVQFYSVLLPKLQERIMTPPSVLVSYDHPSLIFASCRLPLPTPPPK